MVTKKKKKKDISDFATLPDKKSISDFKPQEKEKAPNRVTTLRRGEEGRSEGEPSGIEIGDGRTFLGLSPEEIQQVANNERIQQQSNQGLLPGQIAGQPGAGGVGGQQLPFASTVEQQQAFDARQAQIQENSIADIREKELIAPGLNSILPSRGSPESREQLRNEFLRLEGLNPEDAETVQGKIARTKQGILRTVRLARGLANALPVVGEPLSKVLGSEEAKINDLKSSLDKRKEMVSSIAESALAGEITVEQARQIINNHERDLEDTELEIQRLAIISPTFTISNDLEDVQVTMLQQRLEVFEARRKLGLI